MNRSASILSWTRYDGSDVEIAYRVTRGEVTHMIARDSAGRCVELDDDEAESCALDILALQALSA